MTTFLLVPGGGGTAWMWHRVEALLEAAGHEVVAVDLPGEDDTKGIDAYADLVVAASRDARDIVLVAQSLGGFTAAVVAPRLGDRLRRIVLVNAMIPLPGETASDWGETTGAAAAGIEAARKGGYSAEVDLDTTFLHDVPADLAREMKEHDRNESPAAFREPARFERWPAVPIEIVIGKDDRLFPPDFQTRVARERLGRDVHITEVPGGHLGALLAHPRELVDVLLRPTR